MVDFTLYDEATAPEASQATLAGLKKTMGFIPNIMAKMAEAPAVLEGYLALGSLVKKTSFTPTERHVVWFTIIHEHRCDYCSAAHAKIAERDGVAADIITVCIDGDELADPKLQALQNFVKIMVHDRGWVSQDKVAKFISQGYTKQQVLEIILLIAHKVMSNYTNHIVKTPIDDEFK